ncbi:MAG: MoxR family ATPase [Chloroflexi bacterium]|nr:MoxR family ATPase [Chloroflexota bacterium]
MAWELLVAERAEPIWLGENRNVIDGGYQVREVAARVQEQIGRVIVGKGSAIELLVAAVFAEGHVLFEDVPGIGKTSLAKALARSLGCTFQRVQCTPDLLPSDVTGVSYFNQQTQAFQFRPGPVFAQVVLADEINRATPRTQSALLEAMEERQVTVDGETRPLPRPFVVLATQNPVELEGTFPLPEAQLDRFLVRLRLGYPTRDEEAQIARRFQEANPLADLAPVAAADELAAVSRVCRRVFVGEPVEVYLIEIVRATRHRPGVELGASPRATLALLHAAQALAAIRGQGFVRPDDVKDLAVPVLAHRLIVGAAGRLRGQRDEEIVREILAQVPVPVEDPAAEPVSGQHRG